MKTLMASALLCCLPGLVMAQSAAKTGDTKAKVKASATSSRTQLRSKAKQVAAGVAAAEAAMTPEELAIAQQIHVGAVSCELGAGVTLVADPLLPGYFDVQAHGQKFRMHPIVTSTGAIRLEDYKAGAVWLQLSNKSMLMNQKLGQRLADECMVPAQQAVAEALKTTPAPSLLEAPVAAPVAAN